jgi:glycosyltransferase involved in cell wall biosynthesis
MNADAFILTSLWEGLPISLLESMYMKKPCIVNNVIGNNDVIHNGDNGYVCDSVEDFISGINDIRKGNAQKYIDKAYNDIFELYNTTAQARAYGQIYKNYIGE